MTFLFEQGCIRHILFHSEYKTIFSSIKQYLYPVLGPWKPYLPEIMFSFSTNEEFQKVAKYPMGLENLLAIESKATPYNKLSTSVMVSSLHNQFFPITNIPP